jgi:prepilin-type N-terminal cleavage/methylation domain-containing protein
MKKRRKMDQGFSLIEVIIAMTVLGIMSMTMIGVLVHGFNLLSRTKQTALATQICQEQVELIRNKPFNSIVSLGTTYTNDKLASLLNGQGTQAIESSVGVDIRKLTVSVSWSFRGQTWRKDVVTLITRSGIDKK